MEGKLLIRPAEPADRSAMERICAHTFEWGDYVPEAWDEWLADQGGPLIVGEVADRVVSLSKITFQTTEQVWLEGMRVEPAYRRRGIAGQFLDYGIAYAKQRGARVVRLGTGYHYRPAHSLSALATLHGEPDDGFWIGFVDGDPARAADVADLALAVRGHAHQAGAQEIAIMLSDLAWLRDAFNTAGFGYGDYGGELWVFERQLGPSEGDHDA
ncbi:GNAT family N-acetyltransferase [Chloroflexota bacterium]